MDHKNLANVDPSSKSEHRKIIIVNTVEYN